jgi:putative DNA methylase
MTYRPKLIEVALPLDAINTASAKEKSIRHGHPSTLHLWWARRPLAACRAVLFGQLVDDPSGWPEEFPTEEAQDKERERIFDIIREMVIWEKSNDQDAIYNARLEIARTFARRDRYAAKADGVDVYTNIERMDRPTAEDVNNYLATRVPPVHDPFAGGGSIPLEAQRLGLRAIATDLNPVAVLINKGLLELPAAFQGQSPVNPATRSEIRRWIGAAGLAADLRYYGARIVEKARKLLGPMYPHVRSRDGDMLSVVAWIWVRTVPSPDPSLVGAEVPLVSSYWLSKKANKQAWLVPVVDRDSASWTFEVHEGRAAPSATLDTGTKTGRGDFRCLLSGVPISGAYIRESAQSRRLGARMVAIVAQGRRGRHYITPDADQVSAAQVLEADGAPDTPLPDQALGFRVQNYGMTRHRDLFTHRQLASVTTLSDLVRDECSQVESDARAVGRVDPESYATAIGIYLAFSLSKTIDGSTTICRWMVQRDSLFNTYSKHALPMTWDFAEVNVIADCTRSFSESLTWTAESVEALGRLSSARPVVAQRNAMSPHNGDPVVFATDPPYYDNIGYADLSDFFYIWLRRTLGTRLPDIFGTMLVPKAEELVATPFRFGGSRDRAAEFFERGLGVVFRTLHDGQAPNIPITIYYAFKQADEGDDSESGDPAAGTSAGWETMLASLIEAGWSVKATWPVRTERTGRSIEIGTNALATSVVLACARRETDAPTATRATFRRLLRNELPKALRHLQHGNIAPVDVAQAAIGPGMAIFSRHAKVLEADGKAMTVRTALQLINEALDEFLSESEGELDSDSRFAVSWFETHGYETGPFGTAETIAKGRNVSVSRVAEAGILTAMAGKVRLHGRSELPADWHPATDQNLTVWEATQHLIKRLEEQGEGPAAELLKALGPVSDQARALAYRLYSTCERRKWAEEARAYNGLVVAWPELERLAAQIDAAPAPTKPATKQGKLFG